MKKKIVFKIISFLLVISFSLFGGYIIIFKYIKHFGIHLSTDRSIAPKNVRIYLQNSPEWNTLKLGNSNLSIGGYGCLLAVIASSMYELGYDYNLKELNKLFKQGNVYTSRGNIIWYKINNLFPKINYKYKRIFGSNTMERDLSNGLLPIVKVKYYQTGIFHWVLIVGSNENGFLVIDPLKQDKKLINLSVHGKVYAYRVLIKNKKDAANSTQKE